ncbi:MAG: CHASE3 domain-containing protein, partial [Planctomycetaceae bacterium]|nr:CHASE3 domain-containing protein [Planctomycetaceae bacterium]
MLRLTVGQRMTVGFVVPAIILTVIGIVSYRNTANLIENNEKVKHAHEVLGGIELLLSYMKDVETGARGFAIAGEERFLESFEAALPEVDPTFNHLKALIADPSQKSRLEALRPLLTARVKHSQDVVAAGKSRGSRSRTRPRQIWQGQRTVRQNPQARRRDARPRKRTVERTGRESDGQREPHRVLDFGRDRVRAADRVTGRVPHQPLDHGADSRG